MSVEGTRPTPPLHFCQAWCYHFNITRVLIRCLFSIIVLLIWSCFLDLWRWPVERCLSGISNYFVWAECLAFCGCIPIPPLPDGEEQFPAPTTGKGWSEWTRLSVPVLFLFVFLERAKSNIRLLADANTSMNESFLNNVQKCIFCFVVLNLRWQWGYSSFLLKCNLN